MNGKNLTELSEKELRKERQNIGMIFQHFNLLMQRTALDNVCFPMEIAGISKKEARKKALEYLKVVGPVSYTHLDVYKRQPYTCPAFSVFLFLNRFRKLIVHCFRTIFKTFL